MKTYEPGAKTHKDENFPVGSLLIGKPYRSAVLAYYRFARAADDVADHPSLSEGEKVRELDQFEATVLGTSDFIEAAIPLREEIQRRGLSPTHAQDLLTAFRQDARKRRYESWDELMQYCAFSAAPVGRFVLDVHGESQSIWAASDNLCSALQIINHLQDCKADYQRLNRVYIPLDALSRHGLKVEALNEPQASPALRACIRELAGQTESLLSPEQLAPQVRNTRLAIEVAVIQELAQKLLALLKTRDPLSENVHLSKMHMIFVMMRAIVTRSHARPATSREDSKATHDRNAA